LLAGELAGIPARTDLQHYLEQQTKFRFDDFLNAGRAAGLPFDQLFAQLRRVKKERGLSNSEAALAAALWAAQQEGCDISHLSLARHFPVDGQGRELDVLRGKLLAADAIILSGPVYFGDRGSLAQSLIDFIASDDALQQSCARKVYAGISVGAKRNGGQETTLIFQLLDMINLNFLSVGNSSETTSQYGGTAVAGDVGQLHSDRYGIDTSIGTGQRVAHVSKLLAEGGKMNIRLNDKLKVHLWLMQDDLQRTGLAAFRRWADEMTESRSDLDIKIFDIAASEVYRCLACDICPTHVGVKDEYRCIVTSADDFFVRNHQELITADAILLCAYSSQQRVDVLSKYQQFIERTRYLRRDSYVFSDLLVAPFVISELSARQNLHLRMLTSAVRHHTVLHRPIIGMVHEDKLLNKEGMTRNSHRFLEAARKLTIGRHLADHPENLRYNPIGYEISAQKAEIDRHSAESARVSELAQQARAKASTDRITIS
jgi:multimeric flavodoxin WrbA